MRVLLLLLVVAPALAACGADGVGGDRAAAERGPARMTIHADTPWSDAELSVDGRTVIVVVSSAPQGTGACAATYDHEVIETDRSVTIGFDRLERTTTTATVACPLIASLQRFELHLDEPLGDRPLFNGVVPYAQRVARRSELADITWLPMGFSRDGTDVLQWPSGAGPVTWQQTFKGIDADWVVYVIQGPAGTLEHDATSVPEPITVHGVSAERYRDEMNGTLETIRWREKGLDLAVSGEMQGPPSFTHESELRRVAEGIQLQG